MKRILIVLMLVGTGAVIALGARKELLEQSAGTDGPSATPAVAGAPAPAGGSAAPTRGGEDGATPVPAEEVDAADEPATGRAPGDAAGAGAAAADRPSADRAGGQAATGAGGSIPAMGDAVQAVDAGEGVGTDEGGSAEAQDPDAEAILLRASAAYAEVRSLRADFVQTMENPLLRRTITSRGTLFQRRPDRFLMRFREPEGDIVVSDGRYFWVYYPSVDEDQVIRMAADRNGAGGVDLQAQFLGDPLARFTAKLEGREQVQDRAAWVLTLTPRQPVGYRLLKVWVDARDHLVRRFELTEENGSVRQFELFDFQVNPALSDDLFHFTPPPGARVVDRG